MHSCSQMPGSPGIPDGPAPEETLKWVRLICYYLRWRPAIPGWPGGPCSPGRPHSPCSPLSLFEKTCSQNLMVLTTVTVRDLTFWPIPTSPFSPRRPGSPRKPGSPGRPSSPGIPSSPLQPSRPSGPSLPVGPLGCGYFHFFARVWHELENISTLVTTWSYLSNQG